MKNIRELLFVVLLFPFLIFSQKDYENGFIIKNDHKIIYGKVKDRKPPPFGKIYKKIKFIKKYRKKKYTANQIEGYKQGDRLFESLWFNVSGQLINEKYSSVPNLGYKQFLKVVVKGYLTYYQWEIPDPESDYIDFIGLFKRKDDNYFVRVSQGAFGLRKKSLEIYFKDYPLLANKIKKNKIKNPIAIAKFYNSGKTKKLSIN